MLNEHYLKYLAAVAYTKKVFCQPNLKKCIFSGKQFILIFIGNILLLSKNIKSVPRYLRNKKKYIHLLSRYDLEKNPTKNDNFLLFLVFV